jgi:hypothetical protein
MAHFRSSLIRPLLRCFDLSSNLFLNHLFSRFLALVQVVTGRKGRQGVTFASDGATVSWTLPTLTINGVIYGARSMEYAGQIDFVDATNGLRASLVFDSESVKVRSWLALLVY